MPSLTPTQLATLRSRPHTHRLRMSIINPPALLTGEIYGTFSRGARIIQYSGTGGLDYSRVTLGQTLKITNSYGDRVVRVQSLSGNQTFGAIAVDANDIVWEDNAPFTIYENWQDYPLIARFTSAGQFFKNWDEAYTDQNSKTSPVCIAGPHQVGELTGATKRFTFNLAGSYATNPSAGLTGYNFTVTPSTGVTVTYAGSGIYYVDITTAGEYWAKATVTDSAGKSQSTYRRIILHNAGYPYQTNFTLSLNGDWNQGGWTAGIELKGAATSVQDYALVLIWQEQKYAGVENYLNPLGTNLVFAGYLKPGTARYNYDLDTVSFDAVTVDALLREHYSHSLTLEAKPTTPGAWYEYHKNLTSGFAAHHVLKWHSTLLEIADVYGLADDYVAGLRRKFAEVNGSDIHSMVSQLLAAIQGKLVCNKYGQMRAMIDGQLLSDNDRYYDLPLVFLIEKQDTLGETTIAQRTAGASRVRLSGLAHANPTIDQATNAVKPFLSKAPGDTYYPRGTAPVEVGNQVVSDQTYTNMLAGRLLAIEQSQIQEVRLAFDGGYLDVLDIVSNELYAMNLDGSDNPLGLVWDYRYLFCRSIRVRHRPEVGQIDLDVAFEPEALGPPGQTEVIVPETPDDTDPDIDEPSWPELPPIDFPTIPPPEPIINTGSLITWGQDGVFVRYKMAEVPDWVDKNTMSAGQWEPAEGGAIDPYWTLAGEQETVNPSEAVIWRCDIGVIYRSIDGGTTWVETTPVSDPPNTWNDTTAPITVEVTFRFMRADVDNQGTFYFVATWQEPDSGSDKWRSWILSTMDNGQTWAWDTLSVVPSPITMDFDFGTGDQGWVGDENYSLPWGTGWVEYPVDAPDDPVTSTEWSDSPADTNCSYGPGYFASPKKTTLPAGGGFGNRVYNQVFIHFSQKVSFSAATISTFSNENNYSSWTRYYIYLSTDGATWSAGSVNGQDYYNRDMLSGNKCFSCTLNPSITSTNRYVRIGVQFDNPKAFTSTNRSLMDTVWARILAVTLTDYTSGATRFRILYANSIYVLAIADDELLLFDIDLSTVAKIGDCTDAEFDAGTYSAACFTPMDALTTVFVYGRFDCTAGTTGLTGIQHIIKLESGTWASVESGWTTDHCGSFVCNADDGSGRRYWAVRNATGTCSLYSDVAALTLIGTVGAINVRPDTFVILDGQTMYAAGKAGAAQLIFQTTNGGTSWADITGSHDITSGVRRMMLL